MPSPPFPREKRPLLGMFFVSGFSALVYQTVWLRLAFASFGVVTPVLSVVVSVTMLGLGLGSFYGGRWADSLGPTGGRRALWAYAAVEALTGLGGWTVPRLFRLGSHALVGLGALDSGPYLAASAGILLLALLPWTFAMGMTFPLALAFLREGEGSQRGFGALYLANVLGALLGIGTASFLLLEVLGFRGTLAVAVALNLAVSGAALAWAGRLRGAKAPRFRAESQPAGPPPNPGGVRWAGILLFLTGFVSLAGEVTWFRTFNLFLGNQVYAFASLLAVYLAATAAGSTLYRRHVRDGRDLMPAGILAWLVPAGLLPLLVGDPRWDPRAWSVLLSLVPFCLLVGYQTPSLVDRYARGNPRAVGRLYALNVAGCFLGPLAASYFLLPAWGEGWTLAFLPLPLASLLFFTDRSGPTPFRWRPVALGALALCLAAGWGLGTTLETFPGALGQRHETLRDVTGTASAVEIQGVKHLYVNGLGLTVMFTTTKIMAHLPLLCLDRPPDRSLAICFGMGTTFRSLTTWGAPVDAVELEPSVPRLFGFFHTDADRVLARPGARVLVDDGRRFLVRTRGRYDLITVDPPPPLWAPVSSLLYSREFYEAAKARLSDRGILAQWTPLGDLETVAAVYRTLAGSFPYVRVFQSAEGLGTHFLASNRPIGVPDLRTATRRMGPAARLDLVEWEKGATLNGILGLVLAGAVPPERFNHFPPGPVITDDRPFNEYFLVRRYLRPWLKSLAVR